MTDLPPELLASILHCPDDDGPRLAAADWLDEHERPADARFVRVQCRLARRAALRVSTREVSDLQDEEAGLIGEHHGRWLAQAARAGPPAAPEWRRGFLTQTRLRRTPDVFTNLEPLSAYPLLEQLAFDGAPGLSSAELARLPALPRLRLLFAVVSGEPLTEDALAALASRPPIELLNLWTDANPPRPALSPDERGRIAELTRRYRRGCPPEQLADVIRPSCVSVRRSRSGALSVSVGHPELATDGETMGRLPGLADLSLILMGEPGGRLPAWVARHPDLRGLHLLGLTAFDRATRLPSGLRRVEISGALLPPALDALADALLGLPELRTVVARVETPPGFGDWLRKLSGHPTLRSLTAHTAAGPEPIDTVDPGPAWSDAAGGVSLTLPGGFARVPNTPRTGGVQTLGTWCEWGDGDPRDRVPSAGPLWLTLERVPGRVRAADAASLLTGPPGELAEVAEWAGPRRGAYHHVTGRCPFARHLRALWRGPDSALRLRAEWPSGDAGEAVARGVADSVASVGA